jgi:hypothetical protein
VLRAPSTFGAVTRADRPFGSRDASVIDMRGITGALATRQPGSVCDQRSTSAMAKPS